MGGFGEILNYGSHMLFEEGAPVTFRLMLFNRTGFWLAETVKGIASSVLKCKWTDHRSKPLIHNFALHHQL
jgi:hypothetical protein